MKVILITGAGSGIGLHASFYLANHGYRVFAAVHRDISLRLFNPNISDIIPIKLDVTHADEIQNAFQQIQGYCEQNNAEFYGLMNNAAQEYLGPIEILPLNVFENELQAGFLGAVAVTQKFLPLLRKSKGRIINISSTNGFCTFKFHATTCANKYAIEAFSDALRMEVQPFGIAVSIIEPGPVNTALMKEKLIAEFTERMASYPKPLLDLYFQNFEHTVENVKHFVNDIQNTPKTKLAKLKCLFTGRVYLHEPEEVSAVILKILESKKPKFRYLIGMQAKMVLVLKRILPASLFDRYIASRVFDFTF